MQTEDGLLGVFGISSTYFVRYERQYLFFVNFYRNRVCAAFVFLNKAANIYTRNDQKKFAKQIYFLRKEGEEGYYEKIFYIRIGNGRTSG